VSANLRVHATTSERRRMNSARVWATPRPHALRVPSGVDEYMNFLRRRSRSSPPPSLAANTMAQSAPLLIGYLCSFLSAPIVLAGLGLRAFGIWALTGALAQYATLLDFGVGQTLVRFVALHDAEGRRDAVGEFLAVGLATVAFVLSALVGLSFIMAGPLARQLHGISAGSMTVLLLCSSVIVSASMLCRVLVAYPIGRRHMFAPNVAMALAALMYFVFSVGIILLGGKLVPYAIANALAGVAGVVITVAIVLCQRPRPPIHWPSVARAKELLNFAVKNQALAIASLVNFQSDKVVLAVFVGPAAAGAYELSNRVALAARSVGVYTVSALVPTLTAWRASGTRDQLISTYGRLTEVTSALSVPCLVLCGALAPLLLRSWLGYAPIHGTVILAALSIAYIANTTTGVGYATAYAEGLPGIPARAAIATAIGNIVLTVTLTPIFGVWGTLTGTVVALTLGAIYQVVLLHSELSVAMTKYWRATLPTLVLSVAVAIPVVAIDLAAAHKPRWLQAVACVVLGAYYLAVYAWFAARRGVLPDAIMRRLPAFPASTL
jgi:O-antigen/teichoic acid export membrane protein